MTDYALSSKDFYRMVESYGLFVANYFAINGSHRMKTFYVMCCTVGAAGMDVFSVDHSSEVEYFHHLKGLIVQVLSYQVASLLGEVVSLVNPAKSVWVFGQEGVYGKNHKSEGRSKMS